MKLPFQNQIQTYLKKRKKNGIDWKNRYAECNKQLSLCEQDRDLLRSQVENWKTRTKTAYGVLDTIIDDGIKWYDPSTLGESGERRYRLDAKVVLENRTFQNEIQRLETDVIKWLALQSKDFEDVRDMRMQLSGIKLLKERLDDLQKFTT